MIPQLALVLVVSAGQADRDVECAAHEEHALATAAMLIGRGDDASAGRALAPGEADATGACALIGLARLSLLGWDEARKLAAVGGAPDAQAPVRSALEALDQLRGGSAELEIEYAQTAIRAAVAAAQDERPEMALLLDHARDLTERLIARGRRAQWPRPFNLLAGELWFEVDRYDEARAAFDRALHAEGSAAAAFGLGRALARLGRHGEACAAIRSVRDASPGLREASRQDLARCR